MVIRWNGFKARRARRNSGIVAADVQQLESRALLAGNVSVSFSSGTLTITGDNADNLIDVTIAEGTVTIAGLDGTTINGEEDDFVIEEVEGDEITKDLKVNMKGGDDVVTLNIGQDVTIGRNVTVDMGKGHDILDVQFDGGVLTVGNDVNIKLGDGDDVLRVDGETEDLFGVDEDAEPSLVVGDDLTVDGGKGEDLISLDGGIAVDDDAKISGGNDDDGISLDVLSVGDDLTIDGGSGHDAIGVYDLAVGDDLNVKGGSGDDSVNASSSDQGVIVGDDLNVDLGSGDDHLVADELVLEVGDDAKIDGGSGTDNGPDGLEDLLDEAVEDRVTVKRFDEDAPEGPEAGDIDDEVDAAIDGEDEEDDE